MKKIFFLVPFVIFFVTSNALATDTQYTIQDIWLDNPSSGGFGTSLAAYAVNDSGYVVGLHTLIDGQPGDPFWWHDGSFLSIPTPTSAQLKPGDSWGLIGRPGAAIDINNSNQFVSWGTGPYILDPSGSGPYRESRTFVFDNGAVDVIHDFTPTSIDSTGTVYGQGQLSGYGAPIDNYTETTWKDGAFITPSINSEPDTRLQASSLTGLKQQLAPGFDPFWGDLTPTDINSFGQIVGYGTYGEAGLTHGFILTPVVTPEPVSMALFGLGGGALALARRRKKFGQQVHKGDIK